MENNQLMFVLYGIGTFTASEVQVNDNTITFMFDQCVTKISMNKISTNEGGYEASDLYKWINTTLKTLLKEAFSDNIKNRLVDISIPSYGQMFGHDRGYYVYFEHDNDELFKPMANWNNHIAKCNRWPYWLRNAINSEVSTDAFAIVDENGYPDSRGAAVEIGVRPIFTLEKDG